MTLLTIFLNFICSVGITLLLSNLPGGSENNDNKDTKNILKEKVFMKGYQ